MSSLLGTRLTQTPSHEPPLLNGRAIALELEDVLGQLKEDIGVGDAGHQDAPTVANVNPRLYFSYDLLGQPLRRARRYDTHAAGGKTTRMRR